ncbi:hypothetical protein, conserved [Plasmodium gonderi]|uniref:Uncharacterized protein n=1 Tax=Plasmodium gonderi TaxID=77519 RepID=A0A1Y1JQV6_PLAGO|nr:hypothetical protein, conserved [Plasmodium gonderi]GAW83878.1 hypothetical protein, conserved [Plasmodium gonderi]
MIRSACINFLGFKQRIKNPPQSSTPMHHVCQTNYTLKSHSKCRHYTMQNKNCSSDMPPLPQNAMSYDTPNFHFIIYGILHGQINEKRCSGKEGSLFLKQMKPHYVLLELCQYRMNKILDIITKKKNSHHYYDNNYNKFTYLPRIHNGFLQNEFIPIIQHCLKNKLRIFLLDRNIHTIKNRLDSRLLYDTSAYRKFFTYCVESISLRHYPFAEFIKLYNQYAPSIQTSQDPLHDGIASFYTKDIPIKFVYGREYYHKNEQISQVSSEQNNEGRKKIEPDAHTNDTTTPELRTIGKPNSNSSPDARKEGETKTKYNISTHTHDAYKDEEIDILKKLNALHILNKRMEILSKPTYDILVEEKCKYIASNIWCFLLNNETNFFEKNSVKKTIFVMCTANIVNKLVQEMDIAYLSLCKKYEINHNNSNPEQLIFENPYSSYGTYVKPHWPLILIKYYFIPYFILYVILNTFYALTVWFYKANFQKSTSRSHKIIDIEV